MKKFAPRIKDGTYQLIMTSTGWYGYTRHYATSDSPIVLVSRDRDEALDEIYRLEREDVPVDAEIAETRFLVPSRSGREKQKISRQLFGSCLP